MEVAIDVVVLGKEQGMSLLEVEQLRHHETEAVDVDLRALLGQIASGQAELLGRSVVTRVPDLLVLRRLTQHRLQCLYLVTDAEVNQERV